ncbi:hypothetical protein Tco_1014213 [Tanacetum coccineum]
MIRQRQMLVNQNPVGEQTQEQEVGEQKQEQEAAAQTFKEETDTSPYKAEVDADDSTAKEQVAGKDQDISAEVLSEGRDGSSSSNDRLSSRAMRLELFVAATNQAYQSIDINTPFLVGSVRIAVHNAIQLKHD